MVVARRMQWCPHRAGGLDLLGKFFKKGLRFFRRVAVADWIDGHYIHRVCIELRLDFAGLADSDHEEPSDKQEHERSGDLRNHQ